MLAEVADGWSNAEIQASWQVPVLHCSRMDDVLNAKVKVWTGFGGAGDPNAPDLALVQTGSDSWCSLTGQQDQAWWEGLQIHPLLPGGGLAHQLVPGPAGRLHARRGLLHSGGTGNTCELYLADSTQKWHFDLACPSAQCAAYGGTIPVTIPNGYPAHAETIVERNALADPISGHPLSPLPDFGQILFTNTKDAYAGTAPAGGFPVYRVEPPVSGNPEMTVSTSLLNWTVTWQHSF